ncbi:MAG TPA: alginate lyase family protein [Chitinophaga sp.]
MPPPGGAISMLLQLMNLFTKYVLSASLLLAGYGGRAQFILQDENALGLLKVRYQRGDTGVVRQVQSLISTARGILTGDTFAVTFRKTKLAPSNDPHDYMSMAPYWWPDSSKPGGVPYIRRDGHINPERYLLHDNSQLVAMAAQVKQLGAAYYFSEDEQYAQRAAKLLQTWFIDTATRMNPHLDYGQYIPGINNGRGIGIIETAGLLAIPDALAMMQKSPAMKPALVKGLKQWYGAYLQWLLTSKNGREEQKEKNNHGTFYDLQVCDYAVFTGQDSIARREIRETSIPRMAVQFSPDGRQPLELARTKSWSYSLFNLTAWTKLALLAQRQHIDLWAQQTAGGQGLEKCIRFLLPYAGKEQGWAYEQIEPFGQEGLRYIIFMAAPHYSNWPAPETGNLELLLY